MRTLLRFSPLLLVLATISGMASVQSEMPSSHQEKLIKREYQLWKTPVRSSHFNDVPHASAQARCEDTQPPEALTTPNPVLVPTAATQKITVSFIVGADGHVHSPLILESAGGAGDRSILRTVRTWRYRPATCNGVPTDAEGKIEFSRR